MDALVERSEQISTAIDALSRVQDGVVLDLVGVHGIGKSILINQIEQQARKVFGPGLRVVRQDMTKQGLGEGFHDDYGPNASLSVLSETFGSSRKLMGWFADALTRELSSADFDGFRSASRDQGNRVERFRHESGDPSDSATDERVFIRGAQEAVDRAFVQAWDEFTTRRRVLICLDPFEEVADDELGHWLVRMALRLPKTLTVLARIPSHIALGGESRRVLRLDVPPFTEEQVKLYLDRRFDPVGVQSKVPEVVYRYTSGHPGGVGLAAQLVNEKPGVDAAELRRILDWLPAEPLELWAGLVKEILKAVQDPVLRDAVDAAAIVRTYDKDLLTTLLAGTDGKVDVDGAYDALRRYGLVQTKSRSSQMHQFIRLSVAAALRVKDKGKWEELNGRAADFYCRLLEKEEEQHDPGTYGRWYKYERPEWQYFKREWLYHAGQLPARRPLTRAQFTGVFLEAFWWWGCYHPFPFNRKLLEDWERTAIAWGGSEHDPKLVSDDRSLAQWLGAFLDDYPVGHIKSKNAPWDRMLMALAQVQQLCGLSKGVPANASPAERAEFARTNALIKIFLAHTRRFADPTDPKAGRFYREALQTFEAAREEWVVGWLLFELADLALERGQAGEAESFIARSAARCLALALDGDGNPGADELAEGDTDWDFELMANLHRARADVYWLRNEWLNAATGYGRAVADAYWFQGEGDRRQPDEYTQRFYLEMTGRTAERVLALAQAGDEDLALRFAAGVQASLPDTPPPSADGLAEAVRGGRVTDICAQLFLPGPESADLTAEQDSGILASPFMNRWVVLRLDRPDPTEALRDLIGGAEPEEHSG